MKNRRRRVQLLFTTLTLFLILFGAVLTLVWALGTIPVSHTFELWGGATFVLSHPLESDINSAAELEAALKAQNPGEPNLRLEAATRVTPTPGAEPEWHCYPALTTYFGDPNLPFPDPNDPAPGSGGPCAVHSDSLSFGSREAVLIWLSGVSCDAPDPWQIGDPCVTLTWSGTDLPFASYVVEEIGSQWISIPFNQTPLTAEDIRLALIPQAGWVARFWPTDPPVVEFWNGFGWGSTGNFLVETGEGVHIRGWPGGTRTLFEPHGATVSGTVYVDENTNGVFDGIDFGIYRRKVRLAHQATGTLLATRWTDSQGNFAFWDTVPPGDTYEIDVAPNPGETWNPPSGIQVVSPASETDHVSGVDFGRDAVPDLSMDLYRRIPHPLQFPCSGATPPGNQIDYCIRFQNIGGWTLAGGEVVLDVPPPDQATYLGDYIGECSHMVSVPGTPILNGTEVTWPFSAFPGDTCTVCVTMQVESPTGDDLTATASIYMDSSGTQDAIPGTPNNDVQTDRDQCSLDPNDKLVTPTGCGDSGYMAPGEILSYKIRFENEGQVDAVRVEITDLLDAALDLETLRVVDSSHTLTDVQLHADRRLVFTFDDIFLPPKSVDPEGSQGFVLFEIEPRPGLTGASKIPNAASIVFDLNPPVLTNTVVNTISTHPLPSSGIPELETCNSIDDDCDGTVDKFVTACGVGECATTGMCIASIDDCTPGLATTEVCDNLDNDCDGTVDSFTTACGLGECVTAGMCLGGVDDCVPLPGNPEVCDNLDNDCDGTVDSYATACGVGECAAAGTCLGGVDNCVPAPPSAEICDGLDNDCDGTPDNGPTIEINDALDNQCVGEHGHGLVDEITGDTGFHDSQNPGDYSWPAQSGATLYEVARATQGDLAQGCGSLTTVSTTLTDPDVPGSGERFFYLVRPRTPHQGSWGYAYDGILEVAAERAFSCEQEWSCDDGVDNDGDGPIDCADPGCQGVGACPEIECADGQDNDGNGLADCLDPACDGVDGCELGQEVTCDDTMDNDADGAIDCADTDCQGVDGCPEFVCDDGLDNDADAAADCLDDDCDGIGICEFGIELSCTDAADNDGDGAVDCEDADCQGFPGCPEFPCDDGLDNDGNGLTDCQDPSCDGVASCEFGQELTCNDGIDNDGNGLIDCLDLACNGIDGCEIGTELTCDDGLDNDGDGDSDCSDLDCDGVGSCEHGAELTCDDGLDNDGDGDVDCDDTDCGGAPGCPDVLVIDFSVPGQHLISLPREVVSPPITSAQDLMDALSAAGLTPVSVSRWNGTSDTWSTWTGGSCSSCGGGCFCIDPMEGVAYMVEVASAGSLSLMAVDSTSTVILESPGPMSVSGTSVISLPFSSPLASASDLMTDIGPFTVSVSRLDPATGTFQTWSGFGVNFAITPGEGYLVRVFQTTAYRPATSAGP